MANRFTLKNIAFKEYSSIKQPNMTFEDFLIDYKQNRKRLMAKARKEKSRKIQKSKKPKMIQSKPKLVPRYVKPPKISLKVIDSKTKSSGMLKKSIEKNFSKPKVRSLPLKNQPNFPLKKKIQKNKKANNRRAYLKRKELELKAAIQNLESKKKDLEWQKNRLKTNRFSQQIFLPKKTTFGCEENQRLEQLNTYLAEFKSEGNARYKRIVPKEINRTINFLIFLKLFVHLSQPLGKMHRIWTQN